MPIHTDDVPKKLSWLDSSAGGSPAYVSVREVENNQIEIAVREAPLKNGHPGASASVRMPMADWLVMIASAKSQGLIQ